MKTFEEFLNHIQKEKITEFTYKSISEFLSEKFSVPKSKIVFYCKMMKELNMIKKVSLSGYCQSVCASCYEYGCTEPPSAPNNYWKVKSFKINNNE